MILMKPKLAYVTHYYPYAGGYGNSVVSHVKLLSKHFDVYFFYLFKMKDGSCLDLSGTVSKEYRLACGFDQVYSSAEIIRGIGGGLAPPTLAFLVLRMAWNTVGRGIPMFFAPYYSGGMEKELEKILESEKISRVWAYGVLGGQICRNISAKHKMLYMCDSNAYLYHNLLKVERNPAIWCMMKFEIGRAHV